VTDSAYRGAMFTAFSSTAGLFLLLPIGVVVMLSPSPGTNLLWGFGTAAALLAPAFAVGYLMAPWSGRCVQRTKGPAFLMAALASGSSVLSAFLLSAANGSAPLAVGHGLLFAFFALPASVLGALLFIGGCERRERDPASADHPAWFGIFPPNYSFKRTVQSLRDWSCRLTQALAGKSPCANSLYF